MKVFLILFSFFFLFSAMNDCCLSEVEEEVSKVSSSAHSESEHAENAENCEECQCLTFCTYNLVTEKFSTKLLQPEDYPLIQLYSFNVSEEKSISKSIFHPPIA